jgi:hypothetical protein
MVEEEEELELGDGQPKGKLQEPYYDGEMNEMVDDCWIGCPGYPYIEFGARAHTKQEVLSTEG